MARSPHTRRMFRHMHPFRRILVWQKAHDFAVACHRATFRRPIGGTAPGFRSQFLRAVDAIADNIAEGAGQRSQRQFARFLEIALSSAHEVDSQLERARALGIFDRDELRRLQEMLLEVKRMLTAFHRAVMRRADEEDASGGPAA
jgi:four helix bundle protein